MRKILSTILVLFMLVALCACATVQTTKGTTIGTTPEKATIKFINAYQEPGSISYDIYFFNMLNEWKAAHPNITVEHNGTSDWDTMLANRKAAFASNDLPNIMYNTGAMDIQEFVKYKYILNLQPYFDKDQAWYNNFVPACLSGCRFPGIDGIWAIPFTGQVGGLYVNMDVLKDAGVTEKPTTVEEFETVLDKISKKGTYVAWGNGGKATDNAPAILIAIIGKLYGANWVEDVYSGKTKYDSNPQVKQALELYKKWLDAGYFGPNFWDMDVTASRNLYYNLGCGFMYSNGHIVNVALSKSVKVDQISYMTFPYFKDVPQNASVGAIGVGDHFSVCDVGTQYEKDMSVDFLRYITIPSNFQKNAEIQKYALFPVVQGIKFPDTSTMQPMVRDFRAALDTIKSGNRPATHDAFGAEAREIMCTAFTKYLMGTITVDEALKQTQAGIDKALAALK
jgi:ABC-type glycerol-3-phosphate transport system substrate-binding protein